MISKSNDPMLPEVPTVSARVVLDSTASLTPGKRLFRISAVNPYGISRDVVVPVNVLPGHAVEFTVSASQTGVTSYYNLFEAGMRLCRFISKGATTVAVYRGDYLPLLL